MHLLRDALPEVRVVLEALVTIAAGLSVSVKVVVGATALRPGWELVFLWGVRLALRVPVVDLHARVAFGT